MKLKLNYVLSILFMIFHNKFKNIEIYTYIFFEHIMKNLKRKQVVKEFTKNII